MEQLDIHLTHRVECLEAEVRKNRQAMRVLAKAVIAGDDNIVEIAEAVLELIDGE